MIPLMRHGTSWACTACAEKLTLRASLPGAFTYDAVVHGTKLARVAGVATRDLLAGACVASWLVNGATPSPVFRRWLTPPFVDVWVELAEVMSGGGWNDLQPAVRDTIAVALGALMIDEQGVGPISKVLAVLAPVAVPLMPDAALAFGIGVASRGEDADMQTAGVAAFGPMMDWFSAQVGAAHDTLSAIAPALTPAQVLDRVLWFDAAGYMYFNDWYWVKDGAREGVVRVEAPFEEASRSTVVDLADETTPALFRAEAMRALDAVV